MSTYPRIIVSRDGIWPTPWSWEATVLLADVPDDEIPRYRDTHTMRGNAFTKRQAHRQAEFAIRTMEVRRP